MNRYERQLIGKRKFLKRVKKDILINPRIEIDPITKKYSLKKRIGDVLQNNLKNFNCYRTTSTNCSCSMCAYLKYNRKIKHRNFYIK